MGCLPGSRTFLAAACVVAILSTSSALHGGPTSISPRATRASLRLSSRNCPASSAIRLRGGCAEPGAEGGAEQEPTTATPASGSSTPPLGRSAMMGMTRSVSYSALDESHLTTVLSDAPELHENEMKVGSTQANAPPVVKQVAEPESPAAKEPLGMEKLSLADEEGAEGVEVQQPEPVHTETEEELAARLEEEARIAEIENKRLKIVIVSSEVAPWSKSGGLADVAEKLSIALSRRGHRVMTVSPAYGHYEGAIGTDIRRSFQLYGGSHECHYLHMWCPTEIGGDPNTTKIGVDRIFVQNQVAFERAGMYGEPGGHDYFDNLFRFALFSWAAVEAPLILPAIAPFGEKVIFIANDWQTGLVPLIIASHYRRWRVYEQARCLFIIHNMGYHGNFPNPQMYNYDLPDPRETPKWTFQDLGLADDLLYDVYKYNFPPEERGDGGEVDDGECCKLLMGAIHISDRIVTVSPSYKDEIQTPQGGKGLDEKIKQRSNRFDGILNGIDTTEWDPMTDKHLAAPFNVDDVSGKAVCKADVQERLGLHIDPAKPLVVFIGRLDPQKGIDVIQSCLNWMMGGDHEGILGDVQLVMMGSGMHEYAEFMRAAEAQYKGRVCGYVGFSSEMEHKLIAGADILLMPSKYEPCGLPQMYAQRYGTLPVVHATGGLKDSVDQWFAPAEEGGESTGTGWKFEPCHEGGLQWGLHNALRLYKKNPEDWAKTVRRAMSKDFSWDKSAEKYEQLFEWVQMDEPVQRPWPFVHHW